MNSLIKFERWLIKHFFKVFFVMTCFWCASISGSFFYVHYNKTIGLENMASANKALKEALSIQLELKEKLEKIIKAEGYIDKQMEDVGLLADVIYKKFKDGKNNDELVCPSCNRKI